LSVEGLEPRSTVGAGAEASNLSFLSSFSSSLVSLKLSMIYLETFSITLRLIGELVVFDESNPLSLGVA
jgi:hypothetical protein